MHITLTLVLEENELYWIERVQEAYSLVSLSALMKDIERNPFQRIADNYFDMDDVWVANYLFSDAYNNQVVIYKDIDSKFGRAVIAKHKRALNMFEEFFNWCLKETE